MDWIDKIDVMDGSLIVCLACAIFIAIFFYLRKQMYKDEAQGLRLNQKCLVTGMRDRDEIIKKLKRELDMLMQETAELLDGRDHIIKQLRKNLGLVNHETHETHEEIKQAGFLPAQERQEQHWWQRTKQEFYEKRLGEIVDELARLRKEKKELDAEYVALARKYADLYNEHEWYRTMVQASYPQVWRELDGRKRIELTTKSTKETKMDAMDKMDGMDKGLAQDQPLRQEMLHVIGSTERIVKSTKGF